MENTSPLKYARFGFLCWASLRGERGSQCCKGDHGVTGDTLQLPAWLSTPLFTSNGAQSGDIIAAAERRKRRRKKCRSTHGLTSAEVRGSACGWGAGSPPSQHGASIRRPCCGVQDHTCQPSTVHSDTFTGSNPEKCWMFSVDGSSEAPRVQRATCMCVALMLPSTFGCHGNSEASGYLKSHESS